MSENIKQTKLQCMSIIAKRSKISPNKDYINIAWNNAENNIDEISNFIIGSDGTISYLGLENDGYYYAGFITNLQPNGTNISGWHLLDVTGGDFVQTEIGDSYEETLKAIEEYASNNNLSLIGSPLDYGNKGIAYILFRISIS